MPPPPFLKLANGEVDLDRRRAHVGGKELRLTTTEAALLAYLAGAPGRTVPRDELLTKVWGYSADAVSRTVDVTVRRLRAKIEPEPAFPVHLLSVHGVGYRFVPVAERAPGAATGVADVTGAADVTGVAATSAGAGAAGEIGSGAAAAGSGAAAEAPVGPTAALPSGGEARAGSHAGANGASASTAAAPAPAARGLLANAGTDEPIGRDAARAAAWEALRAGARPLTLAGPAGVGKTRLARSLVDEARAAGRPAWLVDLVAADTADDLAVATAAALGADRPTDDAIARVLARPDALLVLDNFEQLAPDAAARVDAWLAAAPAAAVVVTSRRPLGLGTERLLRIEPLAPDDAVDLFRRRARRVRADVRLDDEVFLRSVVARLDGLPLAIELAAVRLRALSVEELSARLALPMLKDAAAHPRRATLSRALDASWVLLDTDARRALAALSALPGASFVAIAERLLANVGIDDPLAAIETLVDHSLVRVEEGPAGTGAARLVPFVVVAEYGTERRAEVGANGAVAAWIGALADAFGEWGAEMLAAAGRPGVARILAESDNVLALLTRHAEAAPAAALRAAATHVDATSAVGGHPAELLVLARALALAEKLGDRDTHARLLSRRVFVLDRAGRLADALADADTVARMAAETPSLALYHTRAELGRVSALRRAGRPGEALAAVDALVIPADASGSFHSAADNERGLILLRLGELAGAAEAFARALSAAEAAGDLQRADAALDHLAFIRVDEGRGAEIEARVRAVLARRQVDAFPALASPLSCVLGSIALEAGRLDEARRAFLAERAGGEARGRKTASHAARTNLGLVALRAGEPVEAATHFRASRDGFLALNPDRAHVVSVTGLALARIGAGERDVPLDMPVPEHEGTPLDAAIHALGAAAVAYAAGEPDGEARLSAALTSPLLAASFDLRELTRYARGLFPEV